VGSRVLVFSSDCHAGLHIDGYKDYVEREYQEDLQRYLDHRPSREAAYRSRLDDEHLVTYEEQREERHGFSGAMDSQRRLKELEADGVVGEVLFPDGTSGSDNEVPFTAAFGHGALSRDARSIELALAGQRAYNRWLAEMVDPDRQVGLALISYHDVAAAVKEINWARGAGLRGVLLDGVDPSCPEPMLPPLYTPYYEPIWAALAEARLPAHFHAGSGYPRLNPGLDTVDISSLGSAIGLVEASFFSHRALWNVLWGGVLERHPALKVVFTEQGSSWAGRAIRYMDWQWSQGQFKEQELLALRPSEYWARQCFLGSSVMTRFEVEERAQIGVEQMMFGTDFPHTEGTWGRTIRYVNAVFGPNNVTEPEARAMLGDNAIRCYELDRQKLQAIADSVGPTVEELLGAADPALKDDPFIETWSRKPPFDGAF
jgi:predicted TIM-barrel fold metal-dependent hydrolase